MAQGGPLGDSLGKDWLILDLGESKSLSKLSLSWEIAYGSGYRVQVSDDTITWKTAATMEGGDGGLDLLDLNNASGRYLRLLLTERGTIYGYR